MTEAKYLSIWTVYDHPSDYPDSFVARRFETCDKVYPTNDIVVSNDLKVLRQILSGMGLFQLKKHRDDDPKIVETWL